MANTLKFGNGQWATKEASTLAYNDENGNFKPLPFDFTRATSATRVNKDGLIEVVGNNEPRIDFKDDAKGALLLEPQRTNSVRYSEAFDNAYWVKNNISIVSGFSSPDGTTNAYKLISNNGGNIIARPTIAQNTTHATSFYLKRVSGNGNVSIFKTNGDEEIVTITDEWQRFTVINSVNPSNAYIGVRLYGLNDEVLVWGAQLEAGSYATSYIPTQGSAVTRVAESCNNSGNNQVINSTEGVLYVEMNAFDSISRISLSDGSTTNRVSFRITDSNIDFQYRVGGSYSYRVDVDVDNSNTNKIAMSFNNGVFVGYLNGVAISSPISGTSLSQGVLDRLNFNDGDSSDSFAGNIKEVKIYNTALTDQELQQLTTI